MDPQVELPKRRSPSDSRLRDPAFRAVFEGSWDAILVTDADGKIIEANAAASVLFGVPCHHLIGKPLSDFSLAVKTTHGELLLRRPDGQEVTLESRAPVNILPGLHLSILRNATDRTKILAEIERTSEKLERAQRTAGVGLFDWDLVQKNGTFTAGFEALFGLPIGGLEGRLENWEKHAHPDDASAAERATREAIAERRPVNVEFRVTRPDGQTRWLNTRAEFIYDADGVPQRIAGVTIDITVQKGATERAERALRLRDEFLSIASHELKTPLATLKLQNQIGQLLAESSQDVLSREKLSQIFLVSSRQIERLARLVNDVLDTTRIQDGKFTLTFAEVNLSELVREICGSSRADLRVEAGLIGSLDRSRIEQVIVNLISNAVKYGAGKPFVVSLVRHGEGARLQIQDLGLGIDPASQSRIFGRFERAISTQNISGLGLGLYITRSIVEGHRGSIGFESKLGQGSTFTVNLPLTTEPLRESI